MTNRQIYSKYTLNEDYFKEINTENKAYILGFIAADGYVHHHGVTIKINKKDKDVLDFIKKELNHNSPLKEITEDRIVLNICSTILSKDLGNFGLFSNKTQSLEFPKMIPSNLYRHFIRGFFDGDGCVAYRKYKDGRTKLGILVNFVGTNSMISSINEIVNSETFIGLKNITLHTKSPVYYLQYQGSKQVKTFYNYLYANYTFCLQRKLEKFKNYYL